MLALRQRQSAPGFLFDYYPAKTHLGLGMLVCAHSVNKIRERSVSISRDALGADTATSVGYRPLATIGPISNN